MDNFSFLFLFIAPIYQMSPKYIANAAAATNTTTTTINNTSITSVFLLRHIIIKMKCSATCCSGWCSLAGALTRNLTAPLSRLPSGEQLPRSLSSFPMCCLPPSLLRRHHRHHLWRLVCVSMKSCVFVLHTLVEYSLPRPLLAVSWMVPKWVAIWATQQLATRTKTTTIERDREKLEAKGEKRNPPLNCPRGSKCMHWKSERNDTLFPPSQEMNGAQGNGLIETYLLSASALSHLDIHRTLE